MSGEREAVEAALAEHQWRPGLNAAHSTHNYNAFCAVCSGDLDAIAAVAVAALDATAPAHDEAAAAWDEAVQAMAWALDNGSPEDALRYVREHNPHLAPTAAEQVAAARAVADRDAARIAEQVRASGEGRER